jgi:hypothetical protein
MPIDNLKTSAGSIMDQAESMFTSAYQALLSVKGLVVQSFGETGWTAACIIAAVLLVTLLSKLAKLSFGAIIYMVIPAVVLAFLGSFVLPMSFAALLPVTATGCSLLFLFKG